MGDRVIHALTTGISMSIAVTSTTVAGHRRKQKQKVLAGNNSKALNVEEKEDLPPSYSESQDVSKEWDLDDAGTQSNDSASHLQELDAQPQEIEAEQFLYSHQIPTTLEMTYRPLPELVLLPQRRPKTRSRGFVRAYAPILGECSGIDQQTFMDFLDNFDKSTRAAPIFNIINIACIGVGFAGHIGAIVSSVVGVANDVAKDMHTRYKTNKFLNDINEKLFKPRGLYVLIMTYKPDRKDEPLLQLEATDDVTKAAAKSLSAESNVLKKKLMMLKSTAGKTTRDENIPPCTPLVYPKLDRSLDLVNTKSSNNQLKLTKSMMDEYLDRRAQVKCAADNKNSSIAKALPPPNPEKDEFVNRFCDPDHPVNSGSIFGLVTGGNWDPIAASRVRKAKAIAHKRGEPELTEEEMHAVYMGRGIRGRKGMHERKRFTVTDNMMQRDLLYMCVVNLPKEYRV